MHGIQHRYHLVNIDAMSQDLWLDSMCEQCEENGSVEADSPIIDPQTPEPDTSHVIRQYFAHACQKELLS